MSTDALFSRTGVRYEVALDVLGAIIAHHSEQIAIERDKPLPDERAIKVIELAKSSLRDLREALDPNDEEGIESIIKRFGQQARDLYASN
ncbi:hypothetical protein J1C51_22330 [Chromobacterium haemolyticum]|uniref:hypothetical protein n=1 Tax=Chromobacterium haemolyticum TaxID=394935 RepID=UPI001A91166D|nr:hypothetical protein [Chromobacterium haemolyticum]MBO0501512.1 hypothetical protein [Chromobacterium haemolyticum]